MKVVKITDGNITVGGTTFEKDVEVEVTKKVGDYLLKTFPNTFRVSEEAKENKGKKDNGRDTRSDDEPFTEERGRFNKRK